MHYENRKTKSDIQRSVLRRFFYYQMANIFITVTAGSILENLGEILNQPSSIMFTLAKNIPTVVGYFISLIVTKTLAGLPIVLLRLGALFRMAFLRICFSEKMLTQRELNEVYRPQEVRRQRCQAVHFLLPPFLTPTSARRSCCTAGSTPPSSS